MSSEHARLTRTGAEWRLDDLDSKNGCGCRATDGTSGTGTLVLCLGVLLILRRRRR